VSSCHDHGESKVSPWRTIDIILSIYSVCQKFLPIADFQIPLNPPFSKGDFRSNSLQFRPLF